MKELINREEMKVRLAEYGKSFYGDWYANFVVTSFEFYDYVGIHADTLKELKLKIKQRYGIDYEVYKHKRNDHI